MTALRLKACAKLNLVLRVLGRRPDGHHLLETLLHQIDLCDELWAERAPGPPSLCVQAERPRAEVGAGPDNLVLRAARAFLAATGVAEGVRFHLKKRIPAGSGLGGGSADAAAALRLCQRLFGRPLPEPALHELARGLGADVPFFLRGGSQWGRGVGDELEPAAGVTARPFLLLIPPFDCPTAAVYGNHASQLNRVDTADSIPRTTDPPGGDSGVPGRYVNDLEQAAERIRPELADLRSRVANMGYPSVRMTGSGSTLFLAFADEHARQDAAQRLRGLEAAGVLLEAARSEPALPRIEPASWPMGWQGDGP